MKTLWKQTQPLHPTFAPLNKCLKEDWFLLPFELQLQRAHAKALEAAGILTGLEQAAVREALEQLGRRHLGSAPPESDAEDLHTWIEAALVEMVGDAGKKIHTARSRNDQVVTLLKMYVIDAGEKLAKSLGGLVRACCLRARDWADLVFPLHTHSQFAAPGSVGFWALRYAVALYRCRCHLDLGLSQWRRQCPLGSGAVAGSTIPLDRRVQAAELGFGGPSLNALDSVSTRDECLQWLSLATQTALHLQSLATDVIMFSQTPLRWTLYPAGFATGSSMMPNKTNPDAMELLRGSCCEILAAQTQAVMLLKGLPSGYNRDLQCIKPVLRGAVDKLLSLCALTEAFLWELQFDEKQLRASVRLGAIDATARMEQKVLAGMSLREAHHAVAGELAGAASDGCANHGAAKEAPYKTVGSAGAEETRRVAGELLARVVS